MSPIPLDRDHQELSNGTKIILISQELTTIQAIQFWTTLSKWVWCHMISDLRSWCHDIISIFVLMTSSLFWFDTFVFICCVTLCHISHIVTVTLQLSPSWFSSAGGGCSAELAMGQLSCSWARLSNTPAQLHQLSGTQLGWAGTNLAQLCSAGPQLALSCSAGLSSAQLVIQLAGSKPGSWVT